MSISRILPKPKGIIKSKWDDDDDDEPQVTNSTNNKQKSSVITTKNSGPPPYGKRQGFVPKRKEDFGDGGAFPEIHIPQYPLDMGLHKSGGRKGQQTSGSTLTLQTNEEGHERYDMVLRRGQGDHSLNHYHHSHAVEKDILENDMSLMRPDEAKVEETTEKTRQALEAVLSGMAGKGQSAIGDIVATTAAHEPTYFRYTPATGDASSGPGTRIIRMMDAPVDPLEPPAIRHRKVPPAPGSPPPPVMHSPPRKVTAEEQKSWYIPPCISNWKNTKGYTIPLDKRLAADGRGLQDVQINDNFAKLSEALFIADRHAREEVKLRAEMQNRLAAKEKREKEEALRLLAQRARDERLMPGQRRDVEEAEKHDARAPSDDDSEDMYKRRGRLSPPPRAVFETGESDADAEDQEEQEQLRLREEIRRERAKQRERELRLSMTGRQARSVEQRDISEKVALGIAQPTLSKESMFDQRLFNQTQGMSSGFSSEDAYNLYDKPLFTGSSAAAIYRPKQADQELGGAETERVERLLGEQGAAPQRGFKGTEATTLTSGAAARSGPVQFEKEVDPFGFTEFMSHAKKGREAEEDGADGDAKRSRH